MPFITITYPPKYPLTESEKKWLGNREFANAVDYGAYSCPSCWWLNKELEECILRRCLRFDPDWQDAAEFEARKSLMAITDKEVPLPCHELHAQGIDDCPYDMRGEKHECEDCFEKALNIAVEAEMEQEK